MGLYLGHDVAPNFGSVNLSAGFVPGVYEIDIVGGGVNDTSNLGENCVGYISSKPDYRLNWWGNTQELYIFFLSDSKDDDPVLVVNDPSGAWFCNDDAHMYTLNPSIRIDHPSHGQYDIWVGSFSKDSFSRGTLEISITGLRRP